MKKKNNVESKRKDIFDITIAIIFVITLTMATFQAIGMHQQRKWLESNVGKCAIACKEIEMPYYELTYNNCSCAASKDDLLIPYSLAFRLWNQSYHEPLLVVANDSVS